MKLRTIHDVVSSHLCSGCGACTYMCPDELEMRDVPDEGRRPHLRSGGESGEGTRHALEVCPGIGLEHSSSKTQAGLIAELEAAWGPVLGIWEGHAADPEIRFRGSSGGAATAIAQYCIENTGMYGVLHTAAQKDVPYLNETVMSRTREELLANTGSRYAPASPCDGLGRIEEAPAPCVFIGKPCDVAATQNARRIRPALEKNLGLTIGFFCAGTPSTRGTLALLTRMGVDDLSSLKSLRYRGNGWPGRATAVFLSPSGLEETRELTYDESWGEVLSKYSQWRCKVCADHTGEFADIAVGDPWYRPVRDGEVGQSLILARTELGRDIVKAAAESGYLEIVNANPAILPASQPNLLRTRGAVWGRILACRLIGTPAPRYRRMPLFRHWWSELTPREKAQSLLGAVKRGWRRRAPRQRAENP